MGAISLASMGKFYLLSYLLVVNGSMEMVKNMKSAR